VAIAVLTPPTPTENNVAANTLLLNYPTGMTSTSFMVLGMTSAVNNLPTLPSGWTQVYRSAAIGGTSTPSAMVAVKQATGSESGTLSVSYSLSTAIGQILAFSGVDLTTPQDVAANVTDTGTAATTTVLAAPTTTMSGCLPVYFAAENAAANTASPPAGWTETADKTGTGQRSGTMGYGPAYSTSGVQSTATVTWSVSARNLGILVVLRPVVVVVPASSNFLMFT